MKNQIAATLEEKLSELVGASRDREDLIIGYEADPLDLVRSNSDREIAVERHNGQARWIQEIEAALEKIKNGGYGACEECEEPISPKRLKAMPWAQLCIGCQSREEASQSPTPIFEVAA